MEIRGATALVVALHHNTTLTTLKLRSNNIGAEGATALGVALHHNTTLITLDLSQNNIRVEGATALRVDLHHNTTTLTTTLDLHSNDIGAEPGGYCTGGSATPQYYIDYT